MNLSQVLRVGRSGFFYTAISITSVMLIGVLLGRIIGVGRISGFLISAGTAICGGSAIAAVGPISNASDEEMAVSLGTVFVLNSVALLAFPVIGSALHLTQTQFGLWSALAIHDTSSVVGATAKFGAIALVVGTTVKLARALWIVPLSLAHCRRHQEQGARSVALVHPVLLPCRHRQLLRPHPATLYPVLAHLGVVGLTVTLYLIGTGLSMATLRQVGIRPLLQGIVLWAIVGFSTLALIRLNWIHL